MPELLDAREAKWGEKMIEIKIRFWTNDLTKGENQIKPKHAWTSGVIRIVKNKPHGITPSSPIPFNSLMEIPAVIEKVLIEHGVKLHVDHNMSKYIQ